MSTSSPGKDKGNTRRPQAWLLQALVLLGVVCIVAIFFTMDSGASPNRLQNVIQIPKYITGGGVFTQQQPSGNAESKSGTTKSRPSLTFTGGPWKPSAQPSVTPPKVVVDSTVVRAVDVDPSQEFPRSASTEALWSWEGRTIVFQGTSSLAAEFQSSLKDTFGPKATTTTVQSLKAKFEAAANETIYGCAVMAGWPLQASIPPKLASKRLAATGEQTSAGEGESGAEDNIATGGAKKQCKEVLRFVFAVSDEENPPVEMWRAEIVARHLVAMGHDAILMKPKDMEDNSGNGAGTGGSSGGTSTGGGGGGSGTTAGSQPKVDVCICVTRCSDANVDWCHANGGQVFWDVAASPLDSWSLTLKDAQVDGFIAGNRLEAAVVATKVKSPVVALYTAHNNDEDMRIDNPRRSVEKVAYLVPKTGVHGQAFQILTGLWNFAAKKQLTVMEDVGGSMGYDPELYRHHKNVRKVDIAIVWPESTDFRTVCSSYMNQLVLWWSHGIPTVFYPCQTYVELALDAGYPFSATSPSEVVATVKKLVNDPGLRSAASEAGLRAAKQLSGVEVARQYVDFLCAYVPYSSGGGHGDSGRRHRSSRRRHLAQGGMALRGSEQQVSSDDATNVFGPFTKID